MIRRWSYLNNLHEVLNVNKVFILNTKYLRFRKVVYWSTPVVGNTRLVRKRLLQKKHYNQFLFFNNIFYFWTNIYLRNSALGKSFFFTGASQSAVVIFPLQPLLLLLTPLFYVTTFTSKTPFSFFFLLTPKTQILQKQWEEVADNITKATPLLGVNTKAYVPSLLTRAHTNYLYYLQQDLFFYLYLISLKEYYLTIQLLFKC